MWLSCNHRRLVRTHGAIPLSHSLYSAHHHLLSREVGLLHNCHMLEHGTLIESLQDGSFLNLSEMQSPRPILNLDYPNDYFRLKIKVSTPIKLISLAWLQLCQLKLNNFCVILTISLLPNDSNIFDCNQRKECIARSYSTLEVMYQIVRYIYPPMND